jgi:hypothetical protein
MRLQMFRDNNRSTHLDLIGNGWSVDLVALTAAGVLILGFIAAIARHLAR